MEGAFETFIKLPLSTLLVVAGIFFLLLAITGSLAGKITVSPQLQMPAAVLGSVFIVVGITLYFVKPVTPDGHVEAFASCDLKPRGRERPGFVCAEAREPIEHLICADADLAYWHGELVRLFNEQLAQQKTPEDKENLRKQERAWISQRDDQCDIPNIADLPPEKLCGKKDCVLSQIKSRVSELERH